MQRLTTVLKAAAGRARAKKGPVLASLTVAVSAFHPIAFFQHGQEKTPHCRLWAIPDRNIFLTGIGEAVALKGQGPERFQQIQQQWQQLLADALLEIEPVPSGAESPREQWPDDPAVPPAEKEGPDHEPGLPGPGPTLMGGFAFDPLQPRTSLWHGFPDAYLAVPRLQLTIAGREAWLTANALVTPADDPVALAADLMELYAAVAEAKSTPPPARPGTDGDAGGFPSNYLNGAAPLPADLTFVDVEPENWQRAVAKASAIVRSGELEKVVLAREVQAAADNPIDAAAVLAALMEKYPSCYIFAVTGGDGCFLGASPEQLVRLQGTDVRVMGLAGTARREADTPLDRELGAALLADPKEREEHAVVVRFIERRLQPFCQDLSVPKEPTLLRIHNVQHLFTPIKATLAPGHSLLDLVARLHPTPAVGGSPREAALADIRRLEQLDRGWYAAPVGWLDGKGDGEFTVAIRSALLRGKGAALFAGCGIMGDSDPEAEFQESRYKLRPMMRALAAGAAVPRPSRRETGLKP